MATGVASLALFIDRKRQSFTHESSVGKHIGKCSSAIYEADLPAVRSTDVISVTGYIFTPKNLGDSTSATVGNLVTGLIRVTSRLIGSRE